MSTIAGLFAQVCAARAQTPQMHNAPDGVASVRGREERLALSSMVVTDHDVVNAEQEQMQPTPHEPSAGRSRGLRTSAEPHAVPRERCNSVRAVGRPLVRGLFLIGVLQRSVTLEAVRAQGNAPQ